MPIKQLKSKADKFPDRSNVRIMLFGTFDILHPGHINFFQQAKRLTPNPYLIVSVARDANVKKIKGKNPFQKERQRLKAVAQLAVVDNAVLGGRNSYLPHIIKQQPKIIALGYDQTAYTRKLAKKLAKMGLKVKIVRLKPFRRKIYKSSIFKTKRFKHG